MTDEAAESRGPATTGTGPSQDRPAPSEPSSGGAPAPDPVQPAPGAGAADVPPPPPPPGAGNPPAGGETPPAAPPPWFGAGADGPTFAKEKLIRPTSGRYVAGVCAALGRATNTDPVLWRVLIAVLGFFGGVGVLIYLIGWLVIPAEGDSASPIESLLGRGRSGMAPFSIVLLGGATVLTFAFVVNDGFRAALLAAAVLIGAVLLLKRNAGGAPATFPAPGPAGATAAPPPPAEAPAAPRPADVPAPAATEPTVAFATAAPADAPPAAAPAEEPVTAPLPPLPPLAPEPPPFAPPTGGYRPPFAPHGPYAGPPPPPPLAPRPPAPRPPKPPREKSKLGRITFFGLVMVLGVLAMVDSAGVSVPVSGYFAAALATIALGLIVGAWFGRARGLIALAIVATIGLGISSGVERFGGYVTNSQYDPQTVAAVADRYDFTLGNATIDLRAVDFTGAEQNTTVRMRAGQVRVLLPERVDTSVDVNMDGRAVIFGRESDGRQISGQTVTDLGTDGAGGGKLNLTIEMNAGNVEVIR
jgi:phage shock protein PspC (stress-responsive transcriptional regulator)